MSEIKGRDLAAPEYTVSVNGENYKLAFNMSALRIAEDTFEDVMHKNLNASAIIMRMASARKMDAALVLIYAFARAGGELDMDYREFERGIEFESVLALKAKAMQGIIEMMPRTNDQKKN